MAFLYISLTALLATATTAPSNKAKLKKNGVRVISARENISDDASGILVEGVLESMAEYYSAELSQKIRPGHGDQCAKVFGQWQQSWFGL